MVPKVKIDAATPKIDLAFCMDCRCAMCRDQCNEAVDGPGSYQVPGADRKRDSLEIKNIT